MSTKRRRKAKVQDGSRKTERKIKKTSAVTAEEQLFSSSIFQYMQREELLCYIPDTWKGECANAPGIHT